MAARFDTITFLSDYGTRRRVRRRRALGDPLDRARRRRHRPHPRHRRPTTCGPAALTLGPQRAQYLCPGVVLAVVDPGVGTPRRGVAIEVGDGPRVPRRARTTACWPRAVAMCGGRHRARRARPTPTYQLRRPGPDLRRSRRVRPGRRPPLPRRAARASSGPRSTPSSLLPGLLPVARDEDGAARRRGALGRPVRQLPAQRRSRRRRAVRRAGSSCRSATWSARPTAPPPTRSIARRRGRPRRRQLRHALGGGRPPLGGGGARHARRHRGPSSRPRRRRRRRRSPSAPVTLTPQGRPR